MKKTIRKILVSILIVGMALAYFETHAQAISTKKGIIMEPSIRYGKLPNGFTYYIKPLGKSQQKLHLKLYVKAGNTQEDLDQLNMAHALEHLAFKASRNLPHGIYKYLDTLPGLRLGHRQLGGAAGGRVVNYNFDAPQNSQTARNAAFLWFKEIATGLNLSDFDIDKERGVLCQELIYRAGDKLEETFLESRFMAKLLPCRKDNSNFFEHHKTFSSKTLRRFYRDWYRPGLMALSVVGYIEDVDVLEKEIVDYFSDMAPHSDPRKLKDCDSLYYARPPQFVREVRKTDTLKGVVNDDVLVRLFFRDSKTKEYIGRPKGLYRLLIWEILTRVLRKRFDAVSKEYNASISVNGIHTYKLDKAPPALMINIIAQNHKEKQGIQQTIKILQQLKKYGIQKKDWNRIKNDMLQSMKNTNLDSPKYWNREILEHFSREEAMPAHKNDIYISWLNNMTLERFNDLIPEFIENMPDDIGIMAPEGHSSLSYSEEQLRTWIMESYTNPIPEYFVPIKPTKLIDSVTISRLKKKGFVENGQSSIGTREILLENGVRVVFKPFKPASGMYDNTILLHGFSPKGASCYSDTDYYSAINAPIIVQNTGVGGMDKFEIGRYLSGTSMEQGVRPYIDFSESGIRGDSSIQDIEKLLQLVYLYFTAPRLDEIAFKDWKKIEEESYQNPSYALAMADFNNAIRETLGDKSVSTGTGPFATRALLGTKRYMGMRETNSEIAYSIYRQLFGNPQDFTFLISGDFKLNLVLPLVQKYLGNLTMTEKSLKCKPINIDTHNYLKGPDFTKINAPKMYTMKNVLYTLKFIKKADNPLNWKEEFKLRVLGVLTNLKIRSLRYEKRLSLYNMTALGKVNRDLSRYEISIQLDCVPEELVEVQRECKNIISEIKSGMVSNEMLEQSIIRLYYMYDKTITGQHHIVQNKLYEHYRFKIPWMEHYEIEQFLKSLTVEDIVATANKYLKEENLNEFIMGSY